MLETHIKIAALICREQDKDKTVGYYKPTKDRWVQYNKHINDKIINNDIISLPFFSTVIADAGQKCLEMIPPNTKKPYLSRETWRKIRTRNDMRANNATNKDIKQLSMEIAKDAKVEKQRDLIERFKENPEDKPKKQMWKAVKELRKKIVPQFVKMKNQKGAHVPLVQRAETIAEYLAHEHWKKSSDADVSNTRKLLEGSDAPKGSFFDP